MTASYQSMTRKLLFIRIFFNSLGSEVALQNEITCPPSCLVPKLLVTRHVMNQSDELSRERDGKTFGIGVAAVATGEDREHQVRRAGDSEQTLYRWRDDFIRAGRGAMNGTAGQSRMQAELKRKERQLAERDQMIGELTVANRILIKLQSTASERGVLTVSDKFVCT